MLISLLFLSVSNFQVFNTILHLLYIYDTDILSSLCTYFVNLCLINIKLGEVETINVNEALFHFVQCSLIDVDGR